ncbi:MAG TPA: CDP-alcohol phosphatidyltransferase family protein, partial [Saprospiraceae bacterium]|nr:CDP-alcohol phosphatidyltransferase family protein [Saprospiraceae bacterium]
MKLVRQIPNALTLTNLLLGTMAIIALTNALVGTAMLLMAGSLVADVFDGAIARKLGIADGLGIQLDSLADMVTFGVLPAMMIFYCG